MTTIHVATAQHESLLEAIQESAAQLPGGADSGRRVLAVLTHTYPDDALDEGARRLTDLLGEGHWIGATTNGFVHNGKRCDALLGNARGVALLSLPSNVAFARADAVTQDPSAAGARLGATIRDQLPDPAGAAFLLTPGLSRAAQAIDEALVKAAHDALPSVAMIGSGHTSGMGPEGFMLGHVLDSAGVHDDAAAIVVFGGQDAAVAAGNGLSGRKPAGTVEMQGPLAVRIGGKPAKARLLELVGEIDPKAAKYFEKDPMMGQVEAGLGLGHEDGTHPGFFWPHVLAGYAGDEHIVGLYARNGEQSHLVGIDPDTCIDSATEVGRELAQDLGGNASFVLASTCGVRGFVLGDRVGEEEVALRKGVTTGGYFAILANGEVATEGKTHERRDVEDFHVTVTDRRPSDDQDYDMEVVGSWNPNVTGGFAGIAPTIDCFDGNGGEVSFTLDLPFSPNETASVVLQELAHTWGLMHVDSEADLLFPTISGVADPAFVDQCFRIVSIGGGGLVDEEPRCPMQYEAFCDPGFQNSYQTLLALFGPAEPSTAAPTLSIVYPPEGSYVDSVFDVELELEDEESPQFFEAEVSLEGLFTQTIGIGGPGRAVIPLSGIPEGEQTLSITVADEDGLEASDVVTFNVGEAPEDPGESATDTAQGADTESSGASEGGTQGEGDTASDSNGDTEDADDTGEAMPTEDDGCACAQSSRRNAGMAALPWLLLLVPRSARRSRRR